MIYAAENMIWLYENIIGVERTEFKRVDFEASLSALFGSMKHEASKSLA